MVIKIIKSICPPILWDFFKKNLGYIINAHWEYMPNGFESRIITNGWDIQSIVDLQVKKWALFKKSVFSSKALGINHESSDQDNVFDLVSHNTLLSYGFVLLLSANNKSKVKVLDWGGGIGHYGIIGQSLLNSTEVQLEYYCYDLEKFCDAGVVLNPDFKYFSNMNFIDNSNFDLVLVSSSLWYENDWKHVLKNLINVTSGYLYITRMNFINVNPSYVAIQRPSMLGYKTEYLCWIFNENELIEYAKSLGLKYLKEFYIGPSFPIFKAPEQGKYKGFLFKK